MKHQRSLLALVALLATAALATEKNEKTESPPAHPEARQAVRTQIVTRLSFMPPFSRVRPREPKAHFHQWVVADGEKRLPFEVIEVSLRGDKRTPVTGYVRLEDNIIFIFDPKTQKHVRSDHDPCFAPPRPKPSTEKPT